MSKHVECGKVHEIDDAALRKLADGVQAEQEEIHNRYGIHCSFFLGMIRQRSDGAEAGPADEDAEVVGSILGCEACAAYFLAHTAIRNARVARMLADALRWIEKLRAEPDAKNPAELADMAVAAGEPN
jgi:hypothetical protein